jgi:hypothetical protein
MNLLQLPKYLDSETCFGGDLTGLLLGNCGRSNFPVQRWDKLDLELRFRCFPLADGEKDRRTKMVTPVAENRRGENPAESYAMRIHTRELGMTVKLFTAEIVPAVWGSQLDGWIQAVSAWSSTV